MKQITNYQLLVNTITNRIYVERKIQDLINSIPQSIVSKVINTYDYINLDSMIEAILETIFNNQMEVYDITYDHTKEEIVIDRVLNIGYSDEQALEDLNKVTSKRFKIRFENAE